MLDINSKILNDYCQKIDAHLESLLKIKPELQQNCLEAMEYSLLAGGKRLRPVLMLEFCRMCGGNPDDYLDLACTIELVHTFSLIHDDLPCMDNDDYRRGQPSCHKKFGESTALLAGDALNTLPFEIISDAAISNQISYKTACMLTKTLSRAIGTDGMIGGQVIDLAAENRTITLEELNILQKYKTGALIEASCVMGCYLANASERISDAISYASNVGRAFQIVDDILDCTGSFDELGKPIGSDEEQNKSTYVTLMGLDKSKDTAKMLTDEAIRILEKFDNSDFLKDLTLSLAYRKK